MSLKDVWKNKIDGIDDILAEDINSIANAVIETQEEINKIVIDQTYSPDSENAQSGKAVAEAVSDKQDSLVSGTNIKTINNQSILGSGNIIIEGGSDVEVDQTFDPESENAQSGKAVAEALTTLGGHWETVMDIVWDFNDYIHVVSYDPETHIFTCNSGELDWATEGERIIYTIAPVCDTNKCKTTEMPFNNFREFSGDSKGKFIGGFVKLSDTEFTFKDTEGNIIPVPNEATMDIAKFHFEHLVPRTISNLNCKKARYTLTDTIQAVNSYNNPPLFFRLGVNEVSSTRFSFNWVYKSVISGVAELINGYGVEKHDILQNITYTDAFVKNETQKIARTTKQPLSNPIITDLKFDFEWNAGLSIPRNGGLFKLERWVE